METGTAIRLAVALIALLVATPARSGEAFENALDASLGVRGLRGAKVGALVVTRDEGVVLYAREAGRPLIPASNQKILTSIATLSAFGPTHHFPIDVYADAAPDGDGVVEHLYLRANGDPSLTSEDYWRLAADLRLAGLRKVTGDVVVDETVFDVERWNPIWGATSSRAYHAPVGAFTVNYGAFTVMVVPGARRGDPAVVRVDPPVPYLEVVNRAQTGGRRAGTSIKLQRTAEADRERIEISGVLRLGGDPAFFRRSVVNPVAYADAVLRMQLAANGIEVVGGLRLGKVPEDAAGLIAFGGNPVSEIVRLFMKYSNNGMAESMLKALGARATAEPGSWANGVPALRAELAKLGLSGEGLVIVDGSGLSYENRVSPEQLVAVMRQADRSFTFGTEFDASLPISGGDGTLKKRFEGGLGIARGKTGLLTSVTALSGFAVLVDGTEVVFSVIVNGFRSTADRAMHALDDFVFALSRQPRPEPTKTP